MPALTPAQLRAVRWYIGDVDSNAPFWGNAKAYVTLNSLFFDGIAAERARAAEGKFLDPAILADENRLVDVLRDLLSAFLPLETALDTYRVERFADFTAMREAGRTLSFTSTSTAGFLPAYQDRIGIALMRFTLPAGTPCIPMAQALPHYAKADEAEVLLPPCMRLQITEMPISAEESDILDANRQPPRISVRAVPMETRLPVPQNPSLPERFRLAGMEVLSDLNAGTEPSAQAVRDFTAWKSALFRG